jgi:anaerobic selenocysteine-containing dehydrogenase
MIQGWIHQQIRKGALSMPSRAQQQHMCLHLCAVAFGYAWGTRSAGYVDRVKHVSLIVSVGTIPNRGYFFGIPSNRGHVK